MRTVILSSIVLIALVAPATFSLAQDSGADVAEIARNLQDPLANINVPIEKTTIDLILNRYPSNHLNKLVLSVSVFSIKARRTPCDYAF
jgi:hypothetical protein